MENLGLYHALFADLTFEELVELYGREIRRRNCMGTVVLSDIRAGGHTHMAAVYPDDWGDLSERPPTEQLLRIAAYISCGSQCGRREVGEDVEGVPV